ncbi:hypothetical protein K438DRAFT_2018263 [Mycena galopus ATCC 62051]|nr:hypothetical protein K438DRAFT_2018263 [Mycena galopus ATCC 62051]
MSFPLEILLVLANSVLGTLQQQVPMAIQRAPPSFTQQPGPKFRVTLTQLYAPSFMPRLLEAAFHINDGHRPQLSALPTTTPTPKTFSSNDLVSAWSNPRSFHVAAKMFLRISTSIPHKKTKPEHERRPLVYPAATPPASITPTPPQPLSRSHLSFRLVRTPPPSSLRVDMQDGRKRWAAPRLRRDGQGAVQRDAFARSAPRHAVGISKLSKAPAAGADALLLAERLTGFLLGNELLVMQFVVVLGRSVSPSPSPPTGFESLLPTRHAHRLRHVLLAVYLPSSSPPLAYSTQTYTRLPASDARLTPHPTPTGTTQRSPGRVNDIHDPHDLRPFHDA